MEAAELSFNRLKIHDNKNSQAGSVQTESAPSNARHAATLPADTIRMIADKLNLRDRINTAAVDTHFAAALRANPHYLRPQGALPLSKLIAEKPTDDDVFRSALRGSNVIECAAPANHAKIISRILACESLEERHTGMNAVSKSFNSLSHESRSLLVDAIGRLPKLVDAEPNFRESGQAQYNRGFATYNLFISSPGIDDEYAARLLADPGQIRNRALAVGPFELSQCSPAVQQKFIDWSAGQEIWKDSFLEALATNAHTLHERARSYLISTILDSAVHRPANSARRALLANFAVHDPERFKTLTAELLDAGRLSTPKDLTTASLFANILDQAQLTKLESAVMDLPIENGYQALLALAANQPVRLRNAYSLALNAAPTLAESLGFDLLPYADLHIQKQIDEVERKALALFQNAWVRNDLSAAGFWRCRKLVIRNLDVLTSKNATKMLTTALNEDNFTDLDRTLGDILPKIASVPRELHAMLQTKLDQCISYRHSLQPPRFSRACHAAIEHLHQLPPVLRMTVWAHLRDGSYLQVQQHFGVVNRSIAKSITASNQKRILNLVLAMELAEGRDIGIADIAKATHSFSRPNLQKWIRALHTLSKDATKDALHGIRQNVDCFGPSLYRNLLHEADIAMDRHASVIHLAAAEDDPLPQK